MVAPCRRQRTETEAAMQSAARILTASPAVLRIDERAAEIPSIGPANEREYECQYCRDSGGRQVDLPGRAGMKQCECVAERDRTRYLALVPERFKGSTFESFKPRDPEQHRALSLMQKMPAGVGISPVLMATEKRICCTRSIGKS
jgi:hypothetical protein